MIWWDWSVRRKAGVLVAMLGLPLVIVIWAFGISIDPRTIFAGVFFLFIPELMVWMLFVGLRTGIMPQRGRGIVRATQPIEFWVTAAVYALLFAVFAGFLLIVVADWWRST